MADQVALCASCSARLSKYRKPREKYCAPCDKRRHEESFNLAHATHVSESRAEEAFRMRWRGLDWSIIAHLVEYPTPSAANSAAREYAKRSDKVLP